MIDLKQYTNEMTEIIRHCFEVHNTLRGGMLEPVYQECLAIEFADAKMPFEREKLLRLIYKGRKLEKEYRADFVCYNSIVVELKAVEELRSEHRMQLYHYLRMTQLPIGLLVNFGLDSLEFEKYGYDTETNNVFLLSRYPSREDKERRAVEREMELDWALDTIQSNDRVKVH